MYTFVFATICITLCLGAVHHEPPNPSAGAGKCLSAKYPNVELDAGQKHFINEDCVKLHCLDDGSINVFGCSPSQSTDGCEMTKKTPDEPYPACCDVEIKC